MNVEDIAARRTLGVGTGPQEPVASQTQQQPVVQPFASVGAPTMADHDAALVSAVLRETPALAKQLAKGGLQALWVVVVLLVVSQVALAWAVLGHAADGKGYTATVDQQGRDLARQGKIIEWLAMCEVARQNGREPPPPPLFLLQGGL